MRHYGELCHDNVCKPALFQCHFSCLNVGKLLVWKDLDSSKKPVFIGVSDLEECVAMANKEYFYHLT